jgi:lipoprotein-releasing system ATP-binding protein
MSVAVRATGLSKSYRDGDRRVEVLRDLELEIAPGEIVAVSGPSGTGKSTLLHILGALDAADSGSVTIDGVEVLDQTLDQQAEFRRRSIGFGCQVHELLPDCTALENVMMPGRIDGWKLGETRKRAHELLDEVGLADRLSHFPSELSGGERQRVALCRALFLSPPLLLADEPTGNLDPENAEVVFELLLQLGRRHSTTAVVVTHNPAIAKRCMRVLSLRDGRLDETH